jgi:hypothetical protein
MVETAWWATPPLVQPTALRLDQTRRSSRKSLPAGNDRERRLGFSLESRGVRDQCRKSDRSHFSDDGSVAGSFHRL